MRVLLVIVSALLLFELSQSTIAAAPPGHDSFEVASIRPNHAGRPFNMGFRPGGRFIAENVNVEILIEAAFGVKDYQVSGGPGWIHTERYDIEAVPDSSTAQAWERLNTEDRQAKQWQMVQALLAERFALKLHRVSKERSSYALVVSKGGARLREAGADLPGPAAGQAQPKHGLRMKGRGEIDAHGASLDRLAEVLSPLLDKIVLNQTGLKGKYDFTLKWSPDDGAENSGAPSIFTALPEQLGLRLETQKTELEMVVLDSVGKPSEN